MKSFINKISNFSENQQLFNSNKKIVVALSGGPDSVALLHVLNALKSKFGIILFAAHFNHNLRASANRDELFVRSLCRRLNIPLSVEKMKILKKKGSIEEIAREARFRFLLTVAKKVNTDTICLGHTTDDLAETVLMRIIRGSGLLGLGGILPTRKIHEKQFIRPLICVTKKEIIDFLKQKKLKYVIDPSNKNKNFLRNKVRLHLLPILEKSYNPSIKKSLSNLSQTVSVDYHYLLLQAQNIFKKITIFSSSELKVAIRIRDFESLDQSLKRIILRLSIEKILGSTRRLTFQHIQNIETFLDNKKTSGLLLQLPKKIKISKNKNFYIIK